jgi:hypothetical protein
MDHGTWSRFSCLLDTPVDSTLEAIKHWQYVHAERRKVDNLISDIYHDSTFEDSDDLTDDQEARVAELYRHLDEVYKTYERGDHTKFISLEIPQPPSCVNLPIPIHFKLAFKEWRQHCRTLSEKPEFIKKLPHPPSIPCTKVGCDNTIAPLKTCVHSLSILYRNAELDRTELLKERNFWHPDRWSRVPQPYRLEVEQMAIVIFQVLQPLCDQARTTPKRGC